MKFVFLFKSERWLGQRSYVSQFLCLKLIFLAMHIFTTAWESRFLIDGDAEVNMPVIGFL